MFPLGTAPDYTKGFMSDKSVHSLALRLPAAFLRFWTDDPRDGPGLIDAELYARAKREGLTWVQVGVRHRPRTIGQTTVRVGTVTETLRELWKLRRTLKQESA